MVERKCCRIGALREHPARAPPSGRKAMLACTVVWGRRTVLITIRTPGLLSFLLLLGLYPAGAQRSSEPPAAAPSNLVLKKTVRRVIVDVAVTDSAGNPVRGLSQSDFLVKEDGKPQQILSFEKHDLESAYVPPKLP